MLKFKRPTSKRSILLALTAVVFLLVLDQYVSLVRRMELVATHGIWSEGSCIERSIDVIRTVTGNVDVNYTNLQANFDFPKDSRFAKAGTRDLEATQRRVQRTDILFASWAILRELAPAFSAAPFRAVCRFERGAQDGAGAWEAAIDFEVAPTDQRSSDGVTKTVGSYRVVTLNGKISRAIPKQELGRDMLPWQQPET